MTRPRYIRHVDLDTGQASAFWREEVAAGVVEMLRPLLEQAVERQLEPVEFIDIFHPRCFIVAELSRDRGLLLRVCAAEGDLVAITVAPSSLAGAALWRTLCQRFEIGGGAKQAPAPAPPAAPWCTTKLLPGMAAYPEAADWIEDLAPCIAWAWLEATR